MQEIVLRREKLVTSGTFSRKPGWLTLTPQRLFFEEARYREPRLVGSKSNERRESAREEGVRLQQCRARLRG